MPTDPLDPILKSAGTDAPLLHRAELQVIGRTVTSLPSDEFIMAATQVCGLSWDDGEPRPPGYFEIHDRRWRIDISGTVNRRRLVTATAAAALVDALRLDRSISWVAQALSAVVTVESVSLDATGLRFRLQRQPAPMVPPHLTDTHNPDDYAEFVRAIRDAAKSLPIPVGGAIEFTDPTPRDP
jgi:hypothetical protein